MASAMAKGKRFAAALLFIPLLARAQTNTPTPGNCIPGSSNVVRIDSAGGGLPTVVSRRHINVPATIEGIGITHCANNSCSSVASSNLISVGGGTAPAAISDAAGTAEVVYGLSGQKLLHCGNSSCSQALV